jgi:hypothetical protein
MILVSIILVVSLDIIASFKILHNNNGHQSFVVLWAADEGEGGLL